MAVERQVLLERVNKNQVAFLHSLLTRYKQRADLLADQDSVNIGEPSDFLKSAFGSRMARKFALYEFVPGTLGGEQVDMCRARVRDGNFLVAANMDFFYFQKSSKLRQLTLTVMRHNSDKQMNVARKIIVQVDKNGRIVRIVDSKLTKEKHKHSFTGIKRTYVLKKDGKVNTYKTSIKRNERAESWEPLKNDYPEEDQIKKLLDTTI